MNSAILKPAPLRAQTSQHQNFDINNEPASSSNTSKRFSSQVIKEVRSFFKFDKTDATDPLLDVSQLSQTGSEDSLVDTCQLSQTGSEDSLLLTKSNSNKNLKITGFIKGLAQSIWPRVQRSDSMSSVEDIPYSLLVDSETNTLSGQPNKKIRTDDIDTFFKAILKSDGKINGSAETDTDISMLNTSEKYQSFLNKFQKSFKSAQFFENDICGADYADFKGLCNDFIKHFGENVGFYSLFYFDAQTNQKYELVLIDNRPPIASTSLKTNTPSKQTNKKIHTADVEKFFKHISKNNGTFKGKVLKTERSEMENSKKYVSLARQLNKCVKIASGPDRLEYFTNDKNFKDLCNKFIKEFSETLSFYSLYYTDSETGIKHELVLIDNLKVN